MQGGRISTHRRRTALLAAVSAIVALGLGSCEQLGVTKQDRITQFAVDLNKSDKSVMSENFAPGTADYASVNTQAFWDGLGMVMAPPATQTYSIALHDYVDPLNVTADIYGPAVFYATVAPGGPNPVPAKFVLVQVGPDWFIEQIYLNGSLTPSVQ